MLTTAANQGLPIVNARLLDPDSGCLCPLAFRVNPFVSVHSGATYEYGLQRGASVIFRRRVTLTRVSPCSESSPIFPCNFVYAFSDPLKAPGIIRIEGACNP